MGDSKFDALAQKVSTEFLPKDEQLAKQQIVVQQVMLDLANLKVRPWNFLQVIRVIQQAVALLGQVTCASLGFGCNINENQLDVFRIMRMQQEEIDEIRAKLKEL